jgi:hypothetical protein
MGVRPLEPVDDREYCFDVATASNLIANYALLAVGGVSRRSGGVRRRAREDCSKSSMPMPSGMLAKRVFGVTAPRVKRR